MLRKLVDSIEAMHAPLRMEEASPEDPLAWFGVFPDWYEEDEQYLVTQPNGGIRVYWPNLYILLNEAKEVLRS